MDKTVIRPLDNKVPANLAEAIRRHIVPMGGVDLVLPESEPAPKPVDFMDKSFLRPVKRAAL